MEDDDRPANLTDRLARIEVKLDQMIEAFKHVSNDHETRIRQLERWKYALPVSALMTVIAGAVAIFGK